MLSNSGILVKYASLASFCMLFCIENLLGQQGPCNFSLVFIGLLCSVRGQVPSVVLRAAEQWCFQPL